MSSVSKGCLVAVLLGLLLGFSLSHLLEIAQVTALQLYWSVTGALLELYWSFTGAQLELCWSFTGALLDLNCHTN